MRQALGASRPVGVGPRHRSINRAGTVKAADIANRAPAGRHFPDNPKPSDHVLFLHGDAGSGSRWVCLRRLQPTGERVTIEGVRNLPSVKVRLPVLLDYIDGLADEPNLYLAQADFFWGEKDDKHRHRARSKYLNSIGTVFVDLDVYNAKRWDGVSIEDIAQRVRDTCAQAGVPDPLIIGSGRGLYANWKLENRIDLRNPSARERWERLQRQLMALLHDYAPDPKVRDATRILRLIGTINPRSGTRVEVLHDDGQVYSLEALERCAQNLSDTLYAPCAQKSAAPAPKIRKSAKRQGVSRGKSSVEADPHSEPLSSPDAIADLKRMLDEDTQAVSLMSRTRAYQYRLFRDIANVVIERGGVAYGGRDEFIFWMLVMRFNAGLYAPDELQGLAGRFAGLTQGGMNVWDAGMLSTLHARMQSQSDEHGQSVIINPIIRRRGIFVAVKNLHGASKRSGAMPLGHGSGYARPMVYTPKASTLIERLGITADEQTRLDCLISPQERKRRDYACSATARRHSRNERILAQASRTKKPMQAIARQNKVSLATTYRVLSKQPEVARQYAEREQEMSHKRAAAMVLLRASGGVTMRAVAEQVGVSVSTVHRWLKASRQSAVDAAQSAKAKRVDQAIRQIALQGKKRFRRTASQAHVSAVSVEPISKNLAVPYSQSSTYSNEGKASVEAETYASDAPSKDVQRLGTESAPGQVSRRFDFVGLAKKPRSQEASCAPRKVVPETASVSDICASHYWEAAQERMRLGEILDVQIPEIPGMEDNVDFMLDVVALYAITMDAGQASGLPKEDVRTLAQTFELLLITLEEMDDPMVLERALEAFGTQLGRDLMQEAYDGLMDITARHARS